MREKTRAKAPALPALREDTIYMAPTGRLVRWVPLRHLGRPVAREEFFAYVRRADNRHGAGTEWTDGFELSPANFKLLKVVA